MRCVSFGFLLSAHHTPSSIVVIIIINNSIIAVVVTIFATLVVCSACGGGGGRVAVVPTSSPVHGQAVRELQQVWILALLGLRAIMGFGKTGIKLKGFACYATQVWNTAPLLQQVFLKCFSFLYMQCCSFKSNVSALDSK